MNLGSRLYKSIHYEDIELRLPVELTVDLNIHVLEDLFSFVGEVSRLARSTGRSTYICKGVTMASSSCTSINDQTHIMFAVSSVQIRIMYDIHVSGIFRTCTFSLLRSPVSTSTFGAVTVSTPDSRLAVKFTFSTLSPRVKRLSLIVNVKCDSVLFYCTLWILFASILNRGR